jgi:hypothetical protein
MATRRKGKELVPVSNKKHRYELSGEVTISVSTVVWARSEAEARRKMITRGNTSGLVDRGHEGSEWITSGELDGEVRIVGCELADDGSEEDEET